MHGAGVCGSGQAAQRSGGAEAGVQPALPAVVSRRAGWQLGSRQPPSVTSRHKCQPCLASPSCTLCRSPGQLCLSAQGGGSGAYLALPWQVAALAGVPVGEAPEPYARNLWCLALVLRLQAALGIAFDRFRTGCACSGPHGAACRWHAVHAVQPSLPPCLSACPPPARPPAHFMPAGAGLAAGDRHRGAALCERGLVARAGAGCRGLCPCAVVLRSVPKPCNAA